MHPEAPNRPDPQANPGPTVAENGPMEPEKDCGTGAARIVGESQGLTVDN